MVLSLEQPETVANIVGMQELIYNKVMTPRRNDGKNR
jgi:hypothetical protein